MTARIHAITATHDTAKARTLGARNAPEHATLVGQVTVNLRRRHELGQDLLAALGKRDDVSGAGRAAHVDWEVLPAWLFAYNIEHLVLLDAQWLSEPLLTEVIQLAANCDLDLSLVAFRPFGDHYDDMISAWPHDISTLDELESVLPELGGDPVEQATAFPKVPTDNYATFRAACRDQLDPETFAIVDDWYLAVADEARDWIEGAEPIDEQVVLAHLADWCNRCATFDEMLVAVRAVQAVAQLHGWYVQVDLIQMLNAVGHPSHAAVRSLDTWQRLAAYREPYRAAACACASLGMTTDDMHQVLMKHVEPDGRRLVGLSDLERPEQAVPAGASVYLRAQRWLRVGQGAGPDDPLFADMTNLIRDRRLVDAIRNPATEVGVALFFTAVRRGSIDKATWARRYGISVQELT